MTAKLIWCGGCEDEWPRNLFHEERRDDRKREVTSLCKQCRSDAYFASRYPETCAQCMKHRPLDSNRVCAKCNEQHALRQCGKCDELLPVYLEFNGNRKTCKQCRRGLRRGR